MNITNETSKEVKIVTELTPELVDKIINSFLKKKYDDEISKVEIHSRIGEEFFRKNFDGKFV